MATVKSRYYESDDKLRLHQIDIAPEHDRGLLPVVCLSGLTRSAPDFLPLAEALAGDPDHSRRVVAFDYRGRGLSDHDPDWRHYDLATERADILAGLAVCGIARAHFVGTSRGGLNIMAMAPSHRALMASVVLNDIGPVIEMEGLVRIKGYVGKMDARPQSWDEAIRLLKMVNGEHFDGLTPDEWRHFAATTFGEDEADLRLRYDPQLARTLDGVDPGKPPPESWDLYDALAGLPLLTIRGANSDLLSEATLAAMGARWPGCETMTVAGQGHAPLLADAPSLRRIAHFLAAADG